MADPERFVRTISAFSVIVGRRVDFVMRKIAFDAFSGVLRRSPVDTGRFRASWRVSIDRIDTSVEPRDYMGPTPKKGASPGGDELRAVSSTLRKVKRTDTVHISNSLPYAVRLENGYSPQAPNGMVTPTVVEIEAGIRRAVEESKRKVPDVR